MAINKGAAHFYLCGTLVLIRKELSSAGSVDTKVCQKNYRQQVLCITHIL